MHRTSDRIKETIEVVEGLVVVDRHCRLMMGRHRRAWVFYTPQILLELSVVGDDSTEIQLEESSPGGGFSRHLAGM